MAETASSGGKGKNSDPVCVIGAGACGLTTVKALKERNLTVHCYEKSNRTSGLWALENSLGKTSAYRSLHIITSRERTQFRDFPMPERYPDYPHRSQVADYLEAYADHFRLRDAIRLNTAVTEVRPRPGGGFLVTPNAGPQKKYRAVIVANGHHSDPYVPHLRGQHEFAGHQMHSQKYMGPDEPLALSDKRVVVIGMGNSAMDIACELAYSGADVTVSARRGAHVIPKWVAGKPVDQTSLLPRWLPSKLRRRINQRLFELIVGPTEDYGLPKPDHGLGDAHPTLSSEFLSLVRNARIRPKPGISELRAPYEVCFADGTSSTADAVVYCTGYNVSFPFFAADFVAAPDNDLPLFMRVHSPRIEGLFFVGLCQTLGAVFPVAEAQAEWIAGQLCGDYRLPPPMEMQQRIADERRKLERRFVNSRRHTMQIDADEYLAKLGRELGRGARRRVSGQT